MIEVLYSTHIIPSKRLWKESDQRSEIESKNGGMLAGHNRSDQCLSGKKGEGIVAMPVHLGLAMVSVVKHEIDQMYPFLVSLISDS